MIEIAIAYLAGATSVAVPAVMIYKFLYKQNQDITLRAKDLEDRILILAEKPHAVNHKTGVLGSVSYMDEKREVELDADATA